MVQRRWRGDLIKGHKMIRSQGGTNSKKLFLQQTVQKPGAWKGDSLMDWRGDGGKKIT